MRRILTTAILVATTIIVHGQNLPDPPKTIDEGSWLQYTVALLVALVLAGFTYLLLTISRLSKDIKKLQDDKDELHGDIVNKIVPALLSSADATKAATALIQTVISKL